jgi:hypothetical protein
MANLTLREVGQTAVNRPLSNTEIDTNFINLNADIATRIPASEKGTVNGVATLDGSGKVPATQLPSYVDDVVEAADLAAFPTTGETGKIYVALDTNMVYRWGGSVYILISSGGSSSSITDGTMYSKTVTTTSGSNNAAVVLDSWSTSIYRSAKYLVQVQNTSGYHSFELMVLHDNATANYAQYADLLMGTANPSNISLEVIGGNVRLLCVPQVSGGTTTKIILSATLLNNLGTEETFQSDLNQGSGTLDLNSGSGTIDLNN